MHIEQKIYEAISAMLRWNGKEPRCRGISEHDWSSIRNQNIGGYRMIVYSETVKVLSHLW